MADFALADTGYWIALFDPRDELHAEIEGTADLLDDFELVVPWPILYETLRTRFVRHRDWVLRLDDQLKRAPVNFIDDHDYCQEAYSLSVEYATRLRRPISMVDMVCRLLIEDPNVRIDYVLTPNRGDFEDVCASRGIEIWP